MKRKSKNLPSTAYFRFNGLAFVRVFSEGWSTGGGAISVVAITDMSGIYQILNVKGLLLFA
jgi:hypothetical protein